MAIAHNPASSLLSVAEGIWDAPIDLSAIKSSILSVSLVGGIATFVAFQVFENIALQAIPSYLEDKMNLLEGLINFNSDKIIQGNTVRSTVISTAVRVSAVALTAYFGLLPSAIALQSIQVLSIDAAIALGASLAQKVAYKVFGNSAFTAAISDFTAILLVAKGVLSLELAPSSLVLGLAKIQSIVSLTVFSCRLLCK